jgi:hypothetical protein
MWQFQHGIHHLSSKDESLFSRAVLSLYLIIDGLVTDNVLNQKLLVRILEPFIEVMSSS